MDLDRDLAVVEGVFAEIDVGDAPCPSSERTVYFRSLQDARPM